MIVVKIVLLAILAFIFIIIVPFCIGWLLSGESLDDPNDLALVYAWLVCVVLFVVVVILWATVPCPFALK